MMENMNKWSIPKKYINIYSLDLDATHIDSHQDKIYVAQLKKIFSSFSIETYEEYFHKLLWFEETKKRECLQELSVECVRLQKTANVNKYTILLTGMEPKLRHVKIGAALLLISRLDSTKTLAYIEDINVMKNIITINVNRSFNFRVKEAEEFQLEVLFIHQKYYNMHNAVYKILKSEHKTKVFPINNVKCIKTKPITAWFNSKLATNAEQRTAVEHIVARTSGSAPYILHGPPGTGKTATIVEAILQVLRMDSSYKVMVCAPSKSAADYVASKLIKYESRFPIDYDLLRRDYSKSDRGMLPKCQNKDTRDVFTRDFRLSYNAQVKPVLSRTRVIVSTVSRSSQVVKKRPFITHLFIDEATQVTEPECLQPILDLLIPKGLLVLSGDPLQLGPALSSPQAKKYGLGTSLMERLMKSDLYSSVHNDPNYTVMLKKNFRSHADILHIPNKQFYNGQLEACATESAISKRNILTEGHPGRAIAFHEVFGQEEQDEQSSSYCNVMELKILKLYIKKILKGKHSERVENIGIITPYTAQVSKIKEWLEDKELGDIEVGSVEAYQGREKNIIFMSTVRGQGTDAYNEGFAEDPKNFNVALTRAKAKIIVIGNPHYLKMDQLWRMYIETCIEMDSYEEKDDKYYAEQKKLKKTTEWLEI